MRHSLAILTALLLAGGTLLFPPGPSAAQSKGDIVIGVQCDRSGPTQIVGTILCPGFHDYIALVNSQGGVEGHKIKAMEIDHEYKVPEAVEAYARFKQAGAVSIAVYGTPQIYALTAKLTEDRIPGTSPGFGRADAADGTRYPYIFPISATYWSQAAAAVDFVKRELGGNLKGKKIAYIFYDNPAGREPTPILEDLAKQEGFQLREFAVPPPGVEMGAQVSDIAQRYRADFVIAHLFGGAPAVSIKEFKRVGYPLRKVISFVWGSAEANIDAAGGFAAAEGYYTMQFAGVGSDYPVLKEIREMYRKEGKPAPKEMASTVFYNRGVLVAALHVEAPERPESPLRREDHGRRREGRLREDLQLRPRWAGATREAHPDGSRGRWARPDLAGEGGQVREGHRLVLGVSRRGGEAPRASGNQVVAPRQTPVRRRRGDSHGLSQQALGAPWVRGSWRDSPPRKKCPVSHAARSSTLKPRS